MTIHKSQGQTYTRVGLSLLQTGLNQRMIYVALSRVTKLQGLYLFGGDTLIPNSLRNLTEEQKKAKFKVIKKDPTRVEMKRMRRHAALENKFDFLNENSNECDLKVLFLNVRSFNKNIKSIRNDLTFKLSDIIFLVECHNNTNYRSNNTSLGLNGYTLVKMTGRRKLNTSCGQMCYVTDRIAKEFDFISHNADENNEYNSTDILEISLFKYHYNKNQLKNILYLCSIYKHPNMNKTRCIEEILTFLSRNRIIQDNNVIQNIFIFGDFNIDFNKPENTELLEALTSFGLIPIINSTKTFIEGSQLDWCFTNILDSDLCLTQTAEIWFSDHCALFTEINMV